VHHHGAGLRVILSRAGVAEAEQDALVRGLQSSPVSSPGLTPNEHALLAYAEALTVSPASICAGHIEALRAAGYGDRAIHDACAIVAYFAFVNRIADGLGVEAEA
jgi:alkylhydroperoxidase family enzyme